MLVRLYMISKGQSVSERNISKVSVYAHIVLFQEQGYMFLKENKVWIDGDLILHWLYYAHGVAGTRA